MSEILSVKEMDNELIRRNAIEIYSHSCDF